MPRQKAAAPTRLAAEERQSASSFFHVETVDLTQDDQPTPRKKKKKSPYGEDLQEILDSCIFYLEVAGGAEPRCKYKLGTLDLKCVTMPESVPHRDKFWLYVSESENWSMLYFEWPGERKKNIQYFRIEGRLNVGLLRALGHKRIFKLVFSEYNALEGSFHVNVWLLETAISKPGDLEIGRGARLYPIQVALQYFCGLAPLEQDASRNESSLRVDTEKLYEEIKKRHTDIDSWEVDVDVQHPDLIPELREYQKTAVRWMIHRESWDQTEPIIRTVKLDGGQELFQHLETGRLLDERPPAPPPVTGGILAEEMGLGKTVEVLALVLCHPRVPIKCEVGENQPSYVPGLVDSSPVKTRRRCSSPSEFFFNEESHDTSSATGASYSMTEGDEDKLLPASPSKKRKEKEKEKRKEKVTKGKQKRHMVKKEELDPISAHIEDVIADYCHNGNHQLLSDRNRKIPPTMYERMKVQYDKALSEMSALSALRRKPPPPRSTFACLCGRDETHSMLGEVIRCLMCKQGQHSLCVRHLPSNGDYYCPQCRGTRPPLRSGATLVVSPTSIGHQWIREIRKCVKNRALRVMLYRGVSAQGYVPPSQLAQCDVVVTSYETLRRELNYEHASAMGIQEEKSLRQQKRFLVSRSPLVSVDWWRLCLDEAQMAEGMDSKVADMALRLTATNRWCVTGTPLQKSLADIQVLLRFLGAPSLPASNGNVQNYSEIATFLQPFLWRSAKRDVLHQIGLPDQTEEIHWLHFSPAEEYFYRRQHKHCAREMILKLSAFHQGVALHMIDRHTLSMLLQPLLSLRQACCHPQMVRGCMLNMKKSNMSMEELLESLIQRTKTEAEEAHRQYVLALNGLAGISLLQGEYVKAVELYREVLNSVRERSSQMKTDPLQLLHTVHNLSQVLQVNHPGVPPTLRDAGLPEEAKQLRDTYLKRTRDGLAAAADACTPWTTQVKELSEGVDTWWADVLEWASERSIRDEDVVVRVQASLTEGLPKGEVPQIQFETCRGLLLMLDRRLDKLQEIRDNLLKSMEKLQDTPPGDLVAQAVVCHLRPQNGEKKGKKSSKKKTLCLACKTHTYFDDLEMVLFRMKDTRVEHDQVESVQLHGELRRGNWADGEAQRVLRVLLSVARGQSSLRHLAGQGSNHIKLLEAVKKEFRLMRIHWRHLNDQVSSYDEVEMAILRLRLMLPGEEDSDEDEDKDGARAMAQLSSRTESRIDRINVLKQHELEAQQARMNADRLYGLSQTKQKLGQLTYLQQLETQGYGRRGTCNPEPCPICQITLGEQWSVLLCGHCFCTDCLRILLSQYGCGTGRMCVRCPVCRQLTHHSDISTVHAQLEDDDELGDDTDRVKGSFSTKVEAVVRTLIRIKRTDPGAKSLVFSSWAKVLESIGEALRQNELGFRKLSTGRNFQDTLRDFASRDDVLVLLIPYHSGANGLNLVEATHVLMVEPVLNPAAHLQAIGRVHRIGQSKPTVVHRFMVRSTVEERIYDILETHSPNVDDKGLTLDDLKQLFSGEEFHGGDAREVGGAPQPGNANEEQDGDNDALRDFIGMGRGANVGLMQ